MHEPQDRLSAIERQLADLQARLAALEAQVFSVPPSDAAPASIELPPLPPRDNLPVQEGEVRGDVLYAGELVTAHGRHRLQMIHKISSLFDTPPESLAQFFAALSNPHRLIILRTLYEGPRSSQALQEVLGMSSAGQLYHHLKELLAAGLIVQRGRRDYDIAPERQVPICVALAVASHLMAGRQGEVSPDQEQAGQEQQKDQEGS